MNSEHVLDHDSLLKLLEPDQFCRLDALQRQQVINAIGPNPDTDLKEARDKAIAAFAIKQRRFYRPMPGFNPIY